jgi:DNA-directed RNA polymerase specialized sigma24 family protein
VGRTDFDGQKLAAALTHNNRQMAFHRFDRDPGDSDYWRDKLDTLPIAPTEDRDEPAEQAAASYLSRYRWPKERAQVMTPDQFAALISIKRGNSPAAQEAARLHLVEGLTQSEAARVAGCSVQSAHNAVKVLLDRMEKCRIAAGFT